MLNTSELIAKEEELIRINQELDQKRSQLKQEYKEIKNKSNIKQLPPSKDTNKQIMTKQQEQQKLQQNEPIKYNEYQEEIDDQNEGLFEKVVRNIKSRKDSKSDTQQNDDKDLENKLINIKKYEDKTSEIQELELITEEQEKILRIQKAKLDVMRSQHENLRSQMQMKETLLQEMQQKGKNIQDQSSKYYAQINSINEKTDLSKQKIADTLTKRKAMERETIIITKELDALKKEFRQVDSEQNKKDLKINRTQEEMIKLKLIAQQSKLASKEKSGDINQQNEQLKRDNQRSESQVVELLNAVKKQIRLADVLKRQRVHLIAAKMFFYVEKEFMNTLDLGQRVKNQ